MKTLFLILFLFNSYISAQSCVFDGKAMKSLGLSEVVNKETLSLFRCSEGHQMWLTNEEIVPTVSSTTSISNIDFLNNEKYKVNSALKNSGLSTEISQTQFVETPSVVKQKIVKSESVSKRETLGSNFSNKLNIEKFGIETLLYNKLESDRIFAEKLEDEKSELLHMMYTQNKLFERIQHSRFSLEKINLFSKVKVYYIYLPLIIAYYLAI